MAKILKSTSLFFQEGTSDKEYHAGIAESNGGFEVVFKYGRRGGPLTSGTKTSGPVSIAEAEKVYGKLVGEKTKKGYEPGTAADVFRE